MKKGVKVGIALVAAGVVVVVIYLSIKLTKKSPDQPLKYACTKEGACVQSPTGTFEKDKCVCPTCPSNCSSENNNGVCDRITGKCACNTGWTGDDCNTPSPPQQTVRYSCTKDGACIESSGGSFEKNQCVCPTCPSNCSGNNNGVCDRITGKCACNTGWTGDDCKTRQPTPPPQTVRYACTKDGACIESSGGSFEKDQCVCPTCPSNCSGHGTCDRITGKCACNSGWTGQDCLTASVPSTNSKWNCGNDHVCVPGDSGTDSQSSCETSCAVPSAELWTKLSSVLTTNKTTFSSKLLQSQDVDGKACHPSTIYNFDGFLKALEAMVKTGVNNNHFYAGDDTAKGLQYGLVNIAAFIAQCMEETIIFDACDENNWSTGGWTKDPKVMGYDPVSNVAVDYPISAACGQAGQSYQDYTCSPSEQAMQCKVDPNMIVKGFTHAAWWGAPPPLFCAPKSLTGPNLGYWDTGGTTDCWPYTGKGITDANEYVQYMKSGQMCQNYDNQKAGFSNISTPVQNMKLDDTVSGMSYKTPRSDVEGCCWWGRGVIQTSGPCNIGKLNYFLGKGAADRGVASLYPNIDFCADPEAICDSSKPTELKWIAGMFYWINAVQSYDSNGWNYLTELKKFVDDGNLDKPITDSGFIHAVSGIVNRGCPNPPLCGTGDLLKGVERAVNFCRALTVFGLTSDTMCGTKPDSPC